MTLTGMSARKISYTDFGGPSQVRAVSLLSSHRHLFRFLFRCDLTASFLQHARKKISFPTIPTRRTLSVTNVTSFVFIFFMSDIRNADTFDPCFSPACGIGVQEERGPRPSHGH
jgi:hypothetical protein